MIGFCIIQKSLPVRFLGANFFGVWLQGTFKPISQVHPFRNIFGTFSGMQHFLTQCLPTVGTEKLQQLLILCGSSSNKIPTPSSINLILGLPGWQMIGSVLILES